MHSGTHIAGSGNAYTCEGEGAAYHPNKHACYLQISTGVPLRCGRSGTCALCDKGLRAVFAQGGVKLGDYFSYL